MNHQLHTNASQHTSSKYQVSVYREQRRIWGCHKHASCRSCFEITRQTIDVDTLQHYVRIYGITTTFMTDPQAPAAESCWFYASTPREDLDELRRGIETYFSLHVHAVNERPASKQDFLEIAKRFRLFPTTSSITTRKLSCHP